MHAVTLLDAFSRLDDPRSARGVRHPFSGMVVLMLLGMLARMREMEVLVRWATIHWDQFREPLGFERDEPPCATTIRRTLAMCRVAEFLAALAANVAATRKQWNANGLRENGTGFARAYGRCVTRSMGFVEARFCLFRMCV